MTVTGFVHSDENSGVPAVMEAGGFSYRDETGRPRALLGRPVDIVSKRTGQKAHHPLQAWRFSTMTAT